MSRLPVAGAWLTGAVFLAAGLMKVADGAHFARSVAAYGMTDDTFAGTVALVLPGMEVAAGACLLTRRHRAAGALAALALSLVFCAALAWRWAHGDTADCGCLGETMKSSVPVALARAGALVALSAYVFLRERPVRATRPRVPESSLPDDVPA